jgi:hypothetical protein
MQPRAAIVAIVVLTVSPAAAAGWNAFGQHEPNTVFDQTGGWMFLNPDTSPDQSVRQVYFNAFLPHYPGTTVDVNLAAADTAFTSRVYAYWAFLGVWKDCNRDGYVGLGEQGVLEYRSALLVDPSVCPPQTTPIDPSTGLPPFGWFPSHNDGNWVRELIPIQWYDSFNVNAHGQLVDHNPWKANDQGARIWLDEGLPGASGAGTTCVINPQPVGTYRSTGGFVKWEDCFDGFRQTDTIDFVASTNPILSPISFADDPRDQYHSHSLLNVANPWGTESDASDAQAWDCSQPQLVNEQVADPTHDVLSQPRTFNVSAPRVPPSVTTGGSVAGTLNATGSGFDRCNRNGLNNGYNSHWGDALAGAPYSNEGALVNQPAKQGTLNMAPIVMDRTNTTWASILGASTPSDLGSPFAGYLDEQEVFDGTSLAQQTGLPVPSVTTPGAGGDGLWFTVPNLIDSRPREFYTTAYAYVSPAAVTTYGLSLPKGTSTGTYGAETCGSATSGVLNGWDCNAADWYKDANGHDVSDRSAWLGPDPTLSPLGNTCARIKSGTGQTSPSDGNTGANTRGCVSYAAGPGSPYDLRAIACYDQSATGARDVSQTTPGIPAVQPLGPNAPGVGPYGPYTVGPTWAGLTNPAFDITGLEPTAPYCQMAH